MSVHRDLCGDFTSADVPQWVLDKVVKNDEVFADVISGGAMAGTGLSNRVAEVRGQRAH
jgi:hypothetical protein